MDNDSRSHFGTSNADGMIVAAAFVLVCTICRRLRLRSEAVRRVACWNARELQRLHVPDSRRQT